MNKDFWMSKAPGIISEAEITQNNSSKNEPKRSHQCFMDGVEAELFPNKRQAVEIPHPNSYTALLNPNIFCGNSSSFQSVSNQFNERLFDNESPTTTNFDSTFGLSMSHPLVEPRSGISYGGIRKVKVNQVKDAEDFISACNKADDESVTTGLSFDRGNDGMISMVDPFNQHNNVLSMDNVCNNISIKTTYNKVDNISNVLSMRNSFGNGENNIISFGGLNDDANSISSYDFMMGQSSLRRSEEKGLSESTSDTISKKKELKATKKTPPNNFPSNVRSLLSTGMLDGVPVKYVAWSREKELRAVIKGAAYLCGCQSCTFSKAINAFEFERHAGCKTKHPNNHIYFENGKTIYGVVQELRNTPQNVLFEVIQTITGSPINQKSFRLWKESFLAATRELQRIYGKEEGKDCVIGS